MSKSKVVVLTGATRGLGRSMVDRLAELGHVVVGCGRSEGAINELKSLGEPHRFDVLDVAGNDAVSVWASTVVAQFGPPDLLINNAAAINKNAPLWDVPVEDFDRVIDVNIKGIANTIRHFAPHMIERSAGVIVNFSSGWGRSTSAEVAPYCASKWAVEGLTQALAQELPAGMAAIPLNPGIINTDMLQSCFGSSASHYPSAEEWSHRAVAQILNFTDRDNGQPMSVT